VSAVVREILSRKRRYYESTIRDAVAQGVIEPCDPAEEAIAFFGLIEGMVSQARIMDDPGSCESFRRWLSACFGVKSRAGSPAAQHQHRCPPDFPPTLIPSKRTRACALFFRQITS